MAAWLLVQEQAPSSIATCIGCNSFWKKRKGEKLKELLIKSVNKDQKINESRKKGDDTTLNDSKKKEKVIWNEDSKSTVSKHGYITTSIFDLFY